MGPPDERRMVHIAQIEILGIQGIMGLIDAEAERRRHYEPQQRKEGDQRQQGVIGFLQGGSFHRSCRIVIMDSAGGHAKSSAANNTDPPVMTSKRYVSGRTGDPGRDVSGRNGKIHCH